MFGNAIGTVAARLAGWCLAACIAGCGGGGGAAAPTSEPNSNETATFGATFAPATLEASTIEGNTTQLEFTATLSYTGSSGVFLFADWDTDVVLAMEATVAGDTLRGTVTLRGDVIGQHSTELRVHACFDEPCSAEVPGSPVVLPIRYEVRPNLQVQQQVTLRRAGREPAPGIVLPVSAPADAGTVEMSFNGQADVFDVTFDGSAIRVGTRQVRAGEYTLTVLLRGSADPRYLRSTEVRYTVEAPAQGEQALAIDPGSVNLFVAQGASVTRRLSAKRPSWTDAWEPPQVVVGADMLHLRDLGGDEYELTIDASGSEIGEYHGAVRFAAGASGGEQYLSVSTSVGAAFYPTGNLNFSLNSRSAPADLHISSPIVTADGVAANWNAASRTPWLRVLRASGQTGVDALELDIDPAFILSSTEEVVAAALDLSIDRPGTLPFRVDVVVANRLPDLQRGPAVLVGDRGRIHVDGALPTDLLEAGVVTVTGANLVAAQLLADTRFVGNLWVLALDVDGAVAGQPITVNATTPLVSSRVSVLVETPTRVPKAYLALPHGAYRAPQYAPGLDALYFAGIGTAYRWAHAGTAWTLSQVAVPGLTDIALRPDEQRLYAVGGKAIRGFDPLSLALISGGELTDRQSEPVSTFDATVPSGMRGLVHASDGRAIASLVTTDYAQRRINVVHWIGSPFDPRILADLTASPTKLDPGGSYGVPDVPTGVALVASANGHTVAATHPAGFVQVYRPQRRVWDNGPALPAGVNVVAVSDDGVWMVRSDGILMIAGRDVGSLAGVLPLTHVAGGFGLTQDGRYGLVYGYRIAIENGAERARDATLRVIDLDRVPATPLPSAPLVATIALDDAVGCTSTARVSGETCRHTASVTLAPGGASAFVLGPRGLAAVPLPATVNVRAAAAGPTRAALASKAGARSRAARLAGTLRGSR